MCKYHKSTKTRHTKRQTNRQTDRPTDCTGTDLDVLIDMAEEEINPDV